MKKITTEEIAKLINSTFTAEEIELLSQGRITEQDRKLRGIIKDIKGFKQHAEKLNL